MNANASESDALRCPTCGADQVASAECRRCKCDLTLVVAARNQARALHQQCLRHLRQGAHRETIRCALRRHEISPDGASLRLLAVAYLCAGRYHAALDVRDRL